MKESSSQAGDIVKDFLGSRLTLLFLLFFVFCLARCTIFFSELWSELPDDASWPVTRLADSQGVPQCPGTGGYNYWLKESGIEV